MKLLYITNGINGIGGLERVLSIKASYFAEELKYEVHIITLNEPEVAAFYKFSELITVHRVMASGKAVSYLKSYMREINRVVMMVQPDIISVCDDGLKGLYVPLWIKKGNAGLIYERHASMRLNHSKVQSLLMKLGGLMYDKVVVLTQYNLTEWLGNNQIVIPNPISFLPQEKATLKDKRIICVGSISHNKGYDLLIEAWNRIVKDCPGWKIDIFGRGDIAKYQKMIDDYHLQDSICFCGPTDQVQEEMLRSSFLVLPSRSEGFGMVLIEAMACGLPCVAFDCPCGPRDIVLDGKNGLLVPPENAVLLAESMKKMIQNSALLEEMATFAPLSVSKYEIASVAQCWQGLFMALMKKYNRYAV